MLDSKICTKYGVALSPFAGGPKVRTTECGGPHSPSLPTWKLEDQRASVDDASEPLLTVRYIEHSSVVIVTVAIV